MIIKEKRTLQTHIIFLLLLFFQIPKTTSTRINLENLPLNPILLDQTQFRLNRLLRYLNQESSEIDKMELFWRVKMCGMYLEQMEVQTARNYGNLVYGTNNKVGGISNIVLGSRNTLIGCKNWVFTADYAGKNTHTLILDIWMINMNLVQTIKINPSIAISKWKNQQ